MAGLNRDTIVAIFLLLFCGLFTWASFDIRTPVVVASVLGVLMMGRSISGASRGRRRSRRASQGRVNMLAYAASVAKGRRRMTSEAIAHAPADASRRDVKARRRSRRDVRATSGGIER